MADPKTHHLRFHLDSQHLAPAFGSDWFGLRAERFARFFGTPTFIIGQTVVVAAWVALNVAGVAHFDVYPFILLNLAFSLQAAYAAPLILIAQTRQADRDKATTESDARHREELALENRQRQAQASEQLALLHSLVERNTELTEATNSLSLRIEELTAQLHQRLVGADDD